MNRRGEPHHNASMTEELPLNRPQSKTDLFLSFTFLALQGFGGVLAVVQRELVERKRWMTRPNLSRTGRWPKFCRAPM